MKRIKRTTLNLAVDGIIGLALAVEVISGIVLALAPEGYRGGRNPAYGWMWLLERHTWLWLHNWFAVLLVVGVIVHLALHWRWIVCVLRGLGRHGGQPSAATG